jgi:hypothetical protein
MNRRPFSKHWQHNDHPNSSPRDNRKYSLSTNRRTSLIDPNDGIACEFSASLFVVSTHYHVACFLDSKENQLSFRVILKTTTKCLLLM